jgi:hypothetical protein
VPIKNTTGGKTFPKRGRLGSGAFFPDGVPIRGNVFGPNADQVVTPTPPADRVFGTPSNAGNGTQFGQSRVDTGVGLDHPNAGFLSLAKQNRVPAMTQASAATTQESPFGHVPVVQPSERNRLHQKKVTPVYKTQSGATRTHLSDCQSASRCSLVSVDPTHHHHPHRYAMGWAGARASGATERTRQNFCLERPGRWCEWASECELGTVLRILRGVRWMQQGHGGGGADGS